MVASLLLDAAAILGEGPVWHHERKTLLWIDIEGHQLHETSADGSGDRVILVGEQIGCIAPAGGSLVVAGLRSGFATIDLETGKRTAITDPEHHLSDNRFNDGKCDPAGRFWAGTMHTHEDPGCGSLYCLDVDLRASCKIPGVSISNGLAWTADARTMYYVDSPTRRVVAYDYDRDTGNIAHARTVFEVPPDEGFPDGMAIDDEGLLWVALWDGRQVIRVDPDAGHVVDRVDVPASRPTSCAFGGDNYDTLFITSARIHLSDAQLSKQPHAGGVFVCKPGVSGPPAVVFAGTAALRARSSKSSARP
jgi:sugar lactone lactonase YvrE